jgi:hypothetical protein
MRTEQGFNVKGVCHSSHVQKLLLLLIAQSRIEKHRFPELEAGTPKAQAHNPLGLPSQPSGSSLTTLGSSLTTLGSSLTTLGSSLATLWVFPHNPWFFPHNPWFFPHNPWVFPHTLGSSLTTLGSSLTTHRRDSGHNNGRVSRQSSARHNLQLPATLGSCSESLGISDLVAHRAVRPYVTVLLSSMPLSTCIDRDNTPYSHRVRGGIYVYIYAYYILDNMRSP